MYIAIVLLAAGEASRIGSIKQLLPYKNTTLLQFAIKQALNSKANTVYCVLGAKADAIKEKIQENQAVLIHNSNWQAGLSSSIVSAISYLLNLKVVPDAVLIMLADQPNVDSDYINELIKLYNNNQNKIVASTYGSVNGVPAIFPSHYFKDLLKLKGDKGAKTYLNKNAQHIVRFISKFSKTLNDIDSPEDYQNLIKKTL